MMLGTGGGNVQNPDVPLLSTERLKSLLLNESSKWWLRYWTTVSSNDSNVSFSKVLNY